MVRYLCCREIKIHNVAFGSQTKKVFIIDLIRREQSVSGLQRKSKMTLVS